MGDKIYYRSLDEANCRAGKMIRKALAKPRRFSTYLYNYGTHSYVIQTNLATGLPARYNVFRIDGFTQECQVIGRELPLQDARALCPGVT